MQFFPKGNLSLFFGVSICLMHYLQHIYFTESLLEL